MTHLTKFKQQLSNLMFLAVFLPGFAGLFVFVLSREIILLPLWLAASITAVVFITSLIIMYRIAIKATQEPIEKIWQAMLHISPHKSDAPAPKIGKFGIGHELISSLVLQIYDLASGKTAVPDKPGQPAIESGSLLEALPFAVFILNKDQTITSTNQAACKYFNLPYEKITGRNVYDVLHMSFTNDDTFDSWLKTIANTRATDTKSWEHARALLDDGKTKRQFDLSASYSKDNPSGNEVILALFDKSESYDKVDDGSSYVAMAVHELRTPLTVLRGYIEVFEDELGDQLTPELKEFMRKMNASAQTLTAFVSNILNVARIDESQLNLSLHEAEWGTVLQDIIKDLELRASVRGKTITVEVEPNLPTVAIDKISMYEVVSNLIDNAIKYSGQSTKINVRVAKSKESGVETVVQDFGVGIPESAMKGLFTKYFRSHRSKNAVSGSGLGLYLVKSIIDAHGGSVWASSKPDEGSSFGFTLQTYAEATAANKAGKDGIERHASGWIKNHSMYRR